MKLPKLNLQLKKTIVILGAGASYGASCFENQRVAAPLDADFFRRLQLIDLLKSDNRIQELLDFVRSEFDVSLQIPMEKFFTQIEALDDFYTTAKIARGPAVQRYAKILDAYTATLAAIFDCISKEVGPIKCSYHEMLAELLQHGNSNFEHDVIISFNYDCLMDEALKAKAEKRWDATDGYGFNISSGADSWHTHNAPGPQATKSIQLLKLHGSLNWKRQILANGKPSSILELRNNAYETSNRSRFEIVPPVWNKNIGDDKILTEVWKKGRQALVDCKVMIVVGYSVPDTDLLSQSLLRVTATEKANKLSHLIIINPDPVCRRKLVATLDKALDTKSMVIELNTLKEFKTQLVG